jgi:hypothetical protein
VTGTLEASGRRASGGHVVGCVTRADAEAIFLAAPTETMADLTVGSGAVADCEATGSGDVDGYTFELIWTPGEAVTVVE